MAAPAPLFGVLIALFVLAFVKNALGLVGMTPEQQDVVTGAVLVGTLIIFGASRNVGETRSWFHAAPHQPARGAEQSISMAASLQATRPNIWIAANWSSSAVRTRR